jgi:hypothetical protein
MPATNSLCSVTRTESALSELYSLLIINEISMYFANRAKANLRNTFIMNSRYLSFSVPPLTSQFLHSFQGLKAGTCTVQGLFSLPPLRVRLWAHPVSYAVRTESSFPGEKRPKRETNHSSPSSAEFKNVWSYISTPPFCLRGAVLN